MEITQHGTAMPQNPDIFEINARVWINRFNTENKKATLNDIPVAYWENLKNKGFDFVWLMGVWKTNPESVKKYCFEEDLMKSYDRALSDWKKDDVIGSPYAIEEYTVNPQLGTDEDLLELKNILNNNGLKLILDFIPNHFNSLSHLIKKDPEIFLETGSEHFNSDSYTFFKVSNGTDKIFAHGRDPFFPAWLDTVQVNYFSDHAREFMINKILEITKFCDGIRCDMAMLSLNNIFENTWGGVLASGNFQKPEKEFWEQAIKVVKNLHPHFVFIAEAYWDLEWRLQSLGFDYTYDKKLTDRLVHAGPCDIRDHLLAEPDYQNRSVRFIENHDEQRAAKILGPEPSKAASVIISTIPGMHLFHDGQFEGKKKKLPVQLGREPAEKPDQELQKFYDRLLEITKNEIFKDGTWKLVDTLPAWENHDLLSYKNILAWIWSTKTGHRLVVVNYDDTKNSCRIKLDLPNLPETIILEDVLNQRTYIRNRDEIKSQGLYVELEQYKSHIFKF